MKLGEMMYKQQAEAQQQAGASAGNGADTKTENGEKVVDAEYEDKK